MAELISAGDFATEGERRAAEVLRGLPPTWAVICNKMLVANNGRSFETDVIVVGDHKIFLIDEKSWQGRIYGNDQQWVRSDGSSERSPLGKADYVSKVLAGLLRAKVPYLGDVTAHFVYPGVLLSRAEALPQIHDPRAADSVFLLSDVCARLVSLDAQGGDPVVGRMRERIKNYLVDLSNRPKVPRKIDLYTIEDAAPGRPGCRVFRAVLEGVGPHTLLVYDLKEDPTNPDALRDFYMREFTAVQQLRDTGLVPDIRGPFTWSEDYLVLPIPPVPGKALGAYPGPSPSSRDEFVQELRLAITAFSSLALIHSRGIVHRALGPESVHVTLQEDAAHVTFSDFHAARVDAGTIASRLNTLTSEDPYAAPELAAGYGFATPESDTYSLALVFLARLSGTSIDVLRIADGVGITLPDLGSRWPFLPREALDDLDDLFRTALSPGPMAPADDPASRRLSAREIAERLEGVLRRLREDVAVGDILDGRYRVLRPLGRGAMAQTYLVTDTEFGGDFAVKKFYRPAMVLQQAKNEFDALRHLASRFLPRIYDVYPPNHDVHVKMDYIPGPTLEEVRTEFPWTVDAWWAFAQGLLDGVGELEERGLIHRDIKPANIILHESDGHPVLIDFGFAVRQGSIDAAAGTPLYLPPEALSADQPPASSDRYAAAVVLFQALTGTLPFAVVDGRADHGERVVVETNDDTVRRLIAVLSRATAVVPDERPATVAELRAQLRAGLIDEGHNWTDELPDLINPWVDEVRRLYRNSDIGNADNRGLDSRFARETYVPTALDTTLRPQVFDLRPKAVFLSGNPGDGKTAFLEQVRAELERRGGTGKVDASGWELSCDGHIFRSCYDASEAHEGQSADAQLMARLSGLEGSTPPQTAVTVLVAINDGRLADFFARNRPHYGWLATQIEQARRGARLDARQVWVVDLKRRAFVALPSQEQSPSVFQRVLDRLVDPARWDACRGCAAQDVCPIVANARTLQRSSGHGVAGARIRLEYLMLLSHLRRQRHTTMRDLRSALSYLITGNASCRQVHATRHDGASTVSLVDLSYWRSAFSPLDSADDLLADLRILDPAHVPQPRLDRYLHFHRSAASVAERTDLFVDHRDLSPQHFDGEDAWLAAVKRRLYFESPDQHDDPVGTASVQLPHWSSLLPYRYAVDFIDLLNGRGDRARIRECLARGISRSDGIPHGSFEGSLSVKVDASTEQQLVVLKQFPLDHFTINVEVDRGADVVERIPETVVFAHMSGAPRLVITLDLFDLLMRLADGLQPDAPEYGPLLEDLVPFKSDLLRRETRDVVLLENGRRVHYVTQQDGKIVRRVKDRLPMP